MRTIILIKLAMLLALKVAAQDMSGDWHGDLKAGNIEVGFVFTISETEEGLKAVMAIPKRNLRNLAAKQTTFKDGELFIDGSNYGWEYRGTFNKDSNEIEGKFKEGINELPLNLKRGKGVAAKARVRAQEPSRPYPYREEEVVFENDEANVRLAGTLTLPQNVTRPLVAILITGSGPQNRDEEIFGHKPFLVLADHLTRQGIAVLRFDDRGVNESTGDFVGATTEDFATDVMAAVDYLKTRTDIDRTKIGLIGHSEGGIIAPMVSAKRPNDIAFLISLAGTGVSGYETTRLQALTMSGLSGDEKEAYGEFISGALNIASSKGDLEEVRKRLSYYYLASDFFNGSIPEGTDKEVVLNSLVQLRTSIWARYFYHYNPAEMYRKVKCPVLSLNGSKDVQVLAGVNQEGIGKALKKGRNMDYTIKELPGLNHFFQEAETGAMNEYEQIEQTFAPSALNEISAWLLARFK